ncbi:MAG TPA: short-chain dehydrogenase [Eubacteriaceae bacterium]|nr:short-chain dehydrogenase [Eubacteriaceae bacterium]
MNKLFDLSGKIAMVTGASSGLGVQFAHALSDFGADVVLLARRKEKLDDVAEQIRKKGREAVAIECDVTEQKDVKSAVKEAIETCGKVDILVNNAGLGGVVPAEEYDYEEWKQIIDVNLNAVFQLSQEVGKVMIEQKYGKIINVASMYGLKANMALPTSAYHASKAGVINLTRALAAEWAMHNITVNAIAPGFFQSEMTEEALSDKSFVDHLKLVTPMQRYGDPGELDGAMVYLASDASSYTTGITIPVDGGTTAV